MALFVGANYLSVDLEVVGTFDVPGVELEIDYTIQQENADNWNGVAGVNWDISQSWAVSVEYNGFVGSREAVVGSLNWRF